MVRRFTITLETDEAFTLYDTGINKIPCIKVIRTYTGWGLRESKIAAETRGKRFTANDMQPGFSVENFCEELRELGATVGIVQTSPLAGIVEALLPEIRSGN